MVEKIQGIMAIKIRIKRNRDISFELKCDNPEALRDLVPELTEEQKRKLAVAEEKKKRLEAEIWNEVARNGWRDLDGNVITPETHEIGYDFGEPDADGMCCAKEVWIRPKISEFGTNFAQKRAKID